MEELSIGNKEKVKRGTGEGRKKSKFRIGGEPSDIGEKKKTSDRRG